MSSYPDNFELIAQEQIHHVFVQSIKASRSLRYQLVNFAISSIQACQCRRSSQFHWLSQCLQH